MFREKSVYVESAFLLRLQVSVADLDGALMVVVDVTQITHISSAQYAAVWLRGFPP